MDDALLDEWFEEAQRAWRESREAIVVEILARYVERRPDHAHAWFIFGDALRVLGRSEEARQALHRASSCKKRIRGYKLHMSLARIEHDCGAYDRAEEHYRRAVEASPDLGFLWIVRGANLAKAGHFVAAEQCHRRATILPAANCDRDEAWLNLGLVLCAQRRYEEAGAAFREALALDAENIQTREALASIEGVGGVLRRLSAFDT